jgi:hypothetical protein
MDAEQIINKYLDQSGQTYQELMAGVSQTGINYVIDELIPKALDENKKIVWVDEDLESGKGHYLLQ